MTASMKDKDKPVSNHRHKSGGSHAKSGGHSGSKVNGNTSSSAIDKYAFTDDDDEAELGKERRRLFHNSAEKKRKDKISRGILHLRDVLPHEYKNGAQRENLSVILDRAAQCIEDMKEKMDRCLLGQAEQVAAEEVKSLRNQVKELTEKNDKLMSVVRQTGVPEEFMLSPELTKKWKSKTTKADCASNTEPTNVAISMEASNENIEEAQSENRKRSRNTIGEHLKRIENLRSEDVGSDGALISDDNNTDGEQNKNATGNVNMLPPGIIIPNNMTGTGGSDPFQGLLFSPNMSAFLSPTSVSSAKMTMESAVMSGVSGLLSLAKGGTLSPQKVGSESGKEAVATGEVEVIHPVESSVSDAVTMVTSEPEAELASPQVEISQANSLDASTNVTQSFNPSVPIMSTNQQAPYNPVAPTNPLTLNMPILQAPNQTSGIQPLTSNPPPLQGSLVLQNGQLILVNDQSANQGLNQAGTITAGQTFSAAGTLPTSATSSHTSTVPTLNPQPNMLNLMPPGVFLNNSQQPLLMPTGQQPLLQPSGGFSLNQSGQLISNQLIGQQPGQSLTLNTQQPSFTQPATQPLVGQQPGIVNMNTMPSQPNQLPSALVLPNGQIVPVVTQPSLLFQNNTSASSGIIVPSNGMNTVNVLKTLATTTTGITTQAYATAQTFSSGLLTTAGSAPPILSQNLAGGGTLTTSALGAGSIPVNNGVMPGGVQLLGQGQSVTQTLKSKDATGLLQSSSSLSVSPVIKTESQANVNTSTGAVMPNMASSGTALVSADGTVLFTLPPGALPPNANQNNILLDPNSLPVLNQVPSQSVVTSQSSLVAANRAKGKKSNQRVLMPKPPGFTVTGTLGLNRITPAAGGMWTSSFPAPIKEPSRSSTPNRVRNKHSSSAAHSVTSSTTAAAVTAPISICVTAPTTSTIPTSNSSAPEATQDILAKAAESIFSEGSPPISGFYNTANEDNPLQIDDTADEADGRSPAVDNLITMPPDGATEMMSTESPSDPNAGMMIDLQPETENMSETETGASEQMTLPVQPPSEAAAEAAEANQEVIEQPTDIGALSGSEQVANDDAGEVPKVDAASADKVDVPPFIQMVNAQQDQLAAICTTAALMVTIPESSNVTLSGLSTPVSSTVSPQVALPTPPIVADVSQTSVVSSAQNVAPASSSPVNSVVKSPVIHSTLPFSSLSASTQQMLSESQKASQAMAAVLKNRLAQDPEYLAIKPQVPTPSPQVQHKSPVALEKPPQAADKSSLSPSIPVLDQPPLPVTTSTCAPATATPSVMSTPVSTSSKVTNSESPPKSSHSSSHHSSEKHSGEREHHKKKKKSKKSKSRRKSQGETPSSVPGNMDGILPPSTPSSSGKKKRSHKSKHIESMPETISFTESELCDVLDKVESLAALDNPPTPNEKKREKIRRKHSPDGPACKKKRHNDLADCNSGGESFPADILETAMKDIGPLDMDMNENESSASLNVSSMNDDIDENIMDCNTPAQPKDRATDMDTSSDPLSPLIPPAPWNKLNLKDLTTAPENGNSASEAASDLAQVNAQILKLEAQNTANKLSANELSPNLDLAITTMRSSADNLHMDLEDINKRTSSDSITTTTTTTTSSLTSNGASCAGENTLPSYLPNVGNSVNTNVSYLADMNDVSSVSFSTNANVTTSSAVSYASSITTLASYAPNISGSLTSSSYSSNQSPSSVTAKTSFDSLSSAVTSSGSGVSSATSVSPYKIASTTCSGAAAVSNGASSSSTQSSLRDSRLLPKPPFLSMDFDTSMVRSPYMPEPLDLPDPEPVIQPTPPSISTVSARHSTIASLPSIGMTPTKPQRIASKLNSMNSHSLQNSISSNLTVSQNNVNTSQNGASNTQAGINNVHMTAAQNNLNDRTNVQTSAQNDLSNAQNPLSSPTQNPLNATSQNTLNNAPQNPLNSTPQNSLSNPTQNSLNSTPQNTLNNTSQNLLNPAQQTDICNTQNSLNNTPSTLGSQADINTSPASINVSQGSLSSCSVAAGTQPVMEVKKLSLSSDSYTDLLSSELGDKTDSLLDKSPSEKDLFTPQPPQAVPVSKDMYTPPPLATPCSKDLFTPQPLPSVSKSLSSPPKDMFVPPSHSAPSKSMTSAPAKETPRKEPPPPNVHLSMMADSHKINRKQHEEHKLSQVSPSNSMTDSRPTHMQMTNHIRPPSANRDAPSEISPRQKTLKELSHRDVPNKRSHNKSPGAHLDSHHQQQQQQHQQQQQQHLSVNVDPMNSGFISNPMFLSPSSMGRPSSCNEASSYRSTQRLTHSNQPAKERMKSQHMQEVKGPKYSSESMSRKSMGHEPSFASAPSCSIPQSQAGDMFSFPPFGMQNPSCASNKNSYLPHPFTVPSTSGTSTFSFTLSGTTNTSSSSGTPSSGMYNPRHHQPQFPPFYPPLPPTAHQHRASTPSMHQPPLGLHSFGPMSQQDMSRQVPPSTQSNRERLMSPNQRSYHETNRQFDAQEKERQRTSALSHSPIGGMPSRSSSGGRGPQHLSAEPPYFMPHNFPPAHDGHSPGHPPPPQLSHSPRFSHPHNAPSNMPSSGNNQQRRSYESSNFNTPNFNSPTLQFPQRPPQPDPFGAQAVPQQKSSNQQRAEESRSKNMSGSKQSGQGSGQQKPSRSKQKKSSKQYEVDTNLANSIFDSGRSMTPLFPVPALSPPPRNIQNDGPTYMPHHLFANTSRPLSNSAPLQHKSPDMNAPFNPLFAPPRPQNGLGGLNFQPGFGMNPAVHGNQIPGNQIPSHSSAHMPNFNLSNLFADVNPSTQDSLNISPIKFPHHGIDHNALQHGQAGAMYPGRGHHPPAGVLHNAMSINSLLGHNAHGFEGRGMTAGINSSMATPFAPHGHAASFGMPPPLNFPLHDH